MLTYFIIFLILIPIFIIILLIYIKINHVKKRKYIETLADSFNLKLQNNYQYSGEIDDYIVNLSLIYEPAERNSTIFDKLFNTLNENKLRIEIQSKNSTKAYYQTFLNTENIQFNDLIQISANNKRNITARLTYELRSLIKDFVKQSRIFQIEKEKLKSLYNIKSTDHSKEIIINNLRIMKKLYDPINENKMLMYNIKNDKNNNVRVKNMRMLLGINKSYKPSREKTLLINKHKNFFKNCLDDNLVEIKAMASYALGEMDFSLLINLLKNRLDHKIISILNLLKPCWNNESMKQKLYKLLETDNIILQYNIIFIFISIKDSQSIKHILKHFDKNYLINTTNEMRKILIKYFIELHVSESIPWLAELYKKNPDYRMQSINALEKIGDISAVEYLLPLTKGFKSFQIKQAAKNAIKNLQKGVSGNKGDLTLTEMENEGELSLSGNDEGKLSDIDINFEKES